VGTRKWGRCRKNWKLTIVDERSSGGGGGGEGRDVCHFGLESKSGGGGREAVKEKGTGTDKNMSGGGIKEKIIKSKPPESFCAERGQRGGAECC